MLTTQKPLCCLFRTILKFHLHDMPQTLHNMPSAMLLNVLHLLFRMMLACNSFHRCFLLFLPCCDFCCCRILEGCPFHLCSQSWCEYFECDAVIFSYAGASDWWDCGLLDLGSESLCLWHKAVWMADAGGCFVLLYLFLSFEILLKQHECTEKWRGKKLSKIPQTCSARALTLLYLFSNS